MEVEMESLRIKDALKTEYREDHGHTTMTVLTLRDRTRGREEEEQK